MAHVGCEALSTLPKGTDFSWGTRRPVAAAVPATSVAAQVFLQVSFRLWLEAEEESVDLAQQGDPPLLFTGSDLLSYSSLQVTFLHQ